MFRARRIRPHLLPHPYLAILIGLLLFTPSTLSAQAVYAANQIPAGGVQVAYRISIENPSAHLYAVEMDVRGVQTDTLQVAMPAWAPGDHRIRNFARNVQNFQVRTRSGNRRLNWAKTDRQTWEILKQPDDDVIVTYDVYSTGLTAEMADISAPATYMYVVGHKHVPVSLRYDKPGAWEIYTGLERRGGAYRAPDYDVFIDAPAFVGEARVHEFTSEDVLYRLVFSDPLVEFNEDQLMTDIRDIVEATVELFGSVPHESYTFLFKIVPTSGSSGLEHLSSTRITVGENDFASGPRYESFLFVVAHEFFHLWNGKRIRPSSESAFDYTKETPTRLLWMTEGLTNYYARLLLARTKILPFQAYQTQLAQEINRLQHAPGRFLMSLEEASWEVWAPSDNSDNNSISYYRKGEIAGFLLDIEIRARTGGERSLDDVMRYLMETYANQGVGVPEDGFRTALNTVVESDFEEFYVSVVQSRRELDYTRYAGQAGLRVRPNRQLPTLYIGIQFVEVDGGLARISRVIPESPASAAGLDTGDILLAFGDRRVTFNNLQSEFRRRKLGETIDLTIARGNRILVLELKPGETQEEVWTIIDTPNVTPEQMEIRNRWIGELN
jgi:predicted metalloprotease with PDZ domain